MLTYKFISNFELSQYNNHMDLIVPVDVGTTLLFSLNDIPVGYICYEGTSSYIMNFEVFKPYRGKGYSKEMFKIFIKAIRPYNNIVKLTALDDELIVYYSKLGFSSQGKQMTYDLNKRK
jgi:hypothetical protein